MVVYMVEKINQIWRAWYVVIRSFSLLSVQSILLQDLVNFSQGNCPNKLTKSFCVHEVFWFFWFFWPSFPSINFHQKTLRTMLPKIAVFGTNALASALISELRRLNFEVLALWDQSSAVAKEWCEHFRIPLPSDCIDELLKDQEVDLVLICSPPHFHKEIATKALAAGKHVICEPPLGLTGRVLLRSIDWLIVFVQLIVFPPLYNFLGGLVRIIIASLLTVLFANDSVH